MNWRCGRVYCIYICMPCNLYIDLQLMFFLLSLLSLLLLLLFFLFFFIFFKIIIIIIIFKLLLLLFIIFLILLLLLFNLFCIQVHKVYFWLWLGRLCVLCVVWMWMYDDSNVCFMHACLLGGRCLGRRCKVLLKHPGYTMRRLCLPESKKKP